jgi:PAS domain-containing protein
MKKEKDMNPKHTSLSTSKVIGEDFFGKLWDESWVYIQTIVDVVHEPVLILDKDFRVMAANDPFYRTFQVEKKETEGTVVYKLGNGQWDIPALRDLLENILPDNTFFNGFEVNHVFPAIGRKVMLLNARQIHYQKDSESRHFPPIILLAIEDVTEIMDVAESLAGRVQEFETSYNNRTEKLELQVARLENVIKKFKKE